MTTESEVPAANNFLQYWTSIIDIAKDSLREAQERQVKYVNEHCRHLIFKVGDQVLLSMKNTNVPVDRNRPTKKLTSRFAGPYTVTQVISSTAYKLDLSIGMRIHPVFHISLLKP